MGDGDEIVAEYHFGHGNADLFGEGIDGAGFGDGQLASRDAEVVLDMGLGGGGEGLRGGEGLVESCDVVHLGGSGALLVRLRALGGVVVRWGLVR